jgi:hypothetical protein
MLINKDFTGVKAISQEGNWRQSLGVTVVLAPPFYRFINYQDTLSAMTVKPKEKSILLDFSLDKCKGMLIFAQKFNLLDYGLKGMYEIT